MGLLSDFCMVSAAELASLDASQSPVKTLPGVQARAVDAVKLVQLQCIIDGFTFKDHKAELGGMLVKDAGEEGPWAFAVPKVITETLASADSQRIEELGRAWALTDEWRLDGGKPEDVVALLRQVDELAKRAQAEGKVMLVWVSL